MTVRNEQQTIGTASVAIAPPRFGRRISISLYNASTSGQKITVKFGQDAAVAGEGYVLNAGVSITDANSEGYECYQGTIQAIADAAGGALSIVERVRG